MKQWLFSTFIVVLCLALFVQLVSAVPMGMETDWTNFASYAGLQPLVAKCQYLGGACSMKGAAEGIRWLQAKPASASTGCSVVGFFDGDGYVSGLSSWTPAMGFTQVSEKVDRSGLPCSICNCKKKIAFVIDDLS